jgi:hypothetical protein
LGGAGVGALIGNSVGKTGAGAAIGAGVGALSGALVGNSLDEMEARNRALIEAKLQRPVSANPVTMDDVVAMTRAGVADEVIVNHVRIHGVAHPLGSNDLIMLQQQGVSPSVVRAMQEPPVPRRETVVVEQSPPPVVIREYPYRPYYYDPYWHPWGGYYYRGWGPRPGVGVGFVVH